MRDEEDDTRGITDAMSPPQGPSDSLFPPPLDEMVDESVAERGDEITDPPLENEGLDEGKTAGEVEAADDTLLPNGDETLTKNSADDNTPPDEMTEFLEGVTPNTDTAPSRTSQKDLNINELHSHDTSLDSLLQMSDGSQNADDLLAIAWKQSLSTSSSQGLDLDSILNGPAPSGGSDYRELDQNEIDNLLGFNSIEDVNKQLVGIDAILNKTMIYYERLPMMEVVFDRLLRLLSTSLRNFTSDNVEISLESIKSTRFGDFLNAVALPAMLGVFHAKEWDNQGLLVVDSALIYSIVDVLLGGRRSITATRVEGRPYTTIERNLIEKLMNVFLEDLKTAFEPVSAINFNFERLEINPHFAMIARAANAGIVIRLHIEIDDRGGRMSLMLPYATIEPIRELLLQNFMGEKFGRDSIWEQHLAKELWETDVEFDIHLAHTTRPLGEVLNWKPGDQVHFSVTPSSLVSALSGDHELFKGMVGQKNGKVAIRVEDNLILKNLLANTAEEKTL